ncbi:uncharacterized protein LOC123316976 isoform X2 [Coccinella septempunctata]|uniref:uncharacterized protein LOC123316976 isoform X2 n=1 Tax=Coccinella septempunctata TaxID=41139 RepID=UPI001D070F8C|nr:uncharacterized protein LOC123316976 isoform X2 [Coccinella septempunctata]
MAKSATLLNLLQLTDAALIGPDLGTVNFRLLHTVLQVIINQVGIGGVKVEFSGSESELIQKMIDPQSQGGIKATQYQIANDAGKQSQMTDGGNVVIVATNGDNEMTPSFTVAVTTEAFAKLTGDVSDLKEKYKELTQMSNNSELVKAVRTSVTGGESGPIVDMYQLLSLTKRVEAAEMGMAKMASMIEDLARESGGGESGGGGGAATKVIQDAAKLRSSIDNGQGPVQDQVKEIERRLSELEKKLAGGNFLGTHLPKMSEPGGPVVGEDFSKTDLSKLNVEDALVLIQREFKNVRNLIQALDVPGLQKKIEDVKGKGGGKHGGGGGDISEKMAQIEVHFHQCVEQINSLDTMFHGKMETVGNQIASIERELGKVYEKVAGMTEQEGAGSDSHLMELYKRFTELENITNNISQTTADLLDEKQERLMHLASIKEQIEMLKTVKADKNEIEGQLADKVDICMINRKVSHEQFDATCTDLTKGIEDALEKLTKQEELWQQALSDIQSEVGAKLDKMELGPLKEFITSKLGVLQSKLKALSKLKKEQEAAGTKAALLKDVKCISCDQDVVMRKHMDPSLFPQPPALPPTKTMAPYLAYELDQLRKQQKNLNASRNLNHFEQIKKGDVCNRYCGGSHTLTTPQQRVTRLGNFLEQWGPEVTTVNDSEIKGKDGMIYRGEDKAEVPVVQAPIIGKGRPSMMVHGDILSARPGFELPEKLSGNRNRKGSDSGSKTAVTFNSPD